MQDMKGCWLASLGVVVAASSAHAGLNDPACKPSATHPNPVVLVHGQGAQMGIFNDVGITRTLEAAGYCVYAVDYGFSNGGYGRAHLAASADQVLPFIESVRTRTGAAKVDLISHSAGTGVVNHILLAKQRADIIGRVISFGGLHHPYAHAGAAQANGSLFLPNLTATARLVDPNVSLQSVINTALSLTGGSLGINAVDLAGSDFVADLFEPNYWMSLHGKLSEPAGQYIVFGANARTLETPDHAATVCYTNIVGAGDVITGESAGFQDESSNVENFRLVTTADHTQIMAEPLAQAKMLAALARECVPAATDPTDPGNGSGTGDGDGGGDGGSGAGSGGEFSAGCSSGPPMSWASLLVVALVIGRLRRLRPVVARQ